MAINYTASTKSLGGMIDGKMQYDIPNYQRSYVWVESKADELWLDLMDVYNVNPEAKDKEYLLGPIVTVEQRQSDKTTYQIIDGQQRLITLTLLFCAIRNSLHTYLSEANKEDQANIANIISKINYSIRNNDEFIRLNNTEDNRFFSKICSNEEISISSGASDSIKNLHNNYKNLLNNANTLCKKCALDISEQRSSGIRKIRDIIEDLKGKAMFVYVQVHNDDYSYQVFQSLNSKGVPLTQSALIKNYLLDTSDSEQKEQVTNRWGNIMDKISNKKHDEYLYESLLSRSYENSKNARKKDLYIFIKNMCKTQTSIDDYLDHLKRDFRIIDKIDKPEVDDTNLRNDLYGLGQINASYFKRPIIAAIREWGLEDPKTKSLINCLVKFFFVYRTICKMDIDPLKTISREITQMIIDKKDLGYILWIILKNKTTSEYEDRIPLGRFIDEFQKRTSTLSQRVMTYILSSFEIKLREHSDIPIIMKNFKIEHIFPKKAMLEDWPDHDVLNDQVSRLGNLTLMDGKWNNKISNWSFTDKRNGKNQNGKSSESYSKSQLEINKQYLTKYRQWTVQEIENREQELTELAKKVWDLSQYIQMAKKPEV